MRIEDLNWLDVEEYLRNENRIILVLGACEQHGYLSLLSDVRIPMALADAASELSRVLVAPPVNFGCSPYFLDYPGTISLQISTLLDLVEDLIRSVYRQGFRKILLLNGHGGNEAARGRLYELANELPELKLAWYAWWTANSVLRIAEKHQLRPAHANWLEAFSFTLVGELPDGEKAPPKVSGLMNAKEARQAYGDGSFGGVYQVDNPIMQEMFDQALQDVVQLLKFE
jgi:creatinine amidohydrolase